MQPTEGPRFRDVIRGLCKVFGAEADAVLLDAYWLALREWPLGEFETAAAHLLRTCKFMPRPADFTGLQRLAELGPHEAWQEAMARCGGWRDGSAGRIGDRVDRAVQCVASYRMLAMADIEEELPHIQRRFLEAYEQLSESEPVREALPWVERPRLNGRSGLRQIGHHDPEAE